MTPADIVPAIPLPCAHIAEDGRVMAINPGIVALFGAEVRGRHYITAFRQPALIDPIETALRKRKRKTARYVGREGGRERGRGRGLVCGCDGCRGAEGTAVALQASRFRLRSHFG